MQLENFFVKVLRSMREFLLNNLNKQLIMNIQNSNWKRKKLDSILAFHSKICDNMIKDRNNLTL